MREVIQTSTFRKWLSQMRNLRAKARIQARISRLIMGNAGDTKVIRNGISEMRIDHGPGYRVYYAHRDRVTILLLCGGDKGTQDRDIQRAVDMAAQWRH